jgi:drug/metabolite transporter (DMT)-like permease
VIHNFYYFFLLQAYAHGDLSHVYPIARGSAPLLVAVLAGRFAGETLVAREVVGVLLVSLAIVALAFSRGLPRAGEGRAIGYALLTGITIAGYTVVDGLGARASGDALGYIAWLNHLGGSVACSPSRSCAGAARCCRICASTGGAGTGGGAVATIGYGIAIWALSLGAMAHVTALRETSSLFGALIGAFILRESFGGRRIAAACLLVAGLLLMNFRLG